MLLARLLTPSRPLPSHGQDVRLLSAGKAPQKAAEVERDLDKADAMIRLLFADVQTLKDGRHPQGEQMYRRYGPAPRHPCCHPRGITRVVSVTHVVSPALAPGCLPGCCSSPRVPCAPDVLHVPHAPQATHVPHVSCAHSCPPCPS